MKNNKKLIDKFSKYILSPVNDNPSVLFLGYEKNKTTKITLAEIKLLDKEVKIILKDEFNKWLFEVKKDEYEDFLFSLYFAKALIEKTKKEE